ncbi:MAG TPA: site-specific DNA-methyltransferase [Candidatus Saccharimonadales bacterium]|nr:site-specific DNA-methyltransferase [Candidatus Saccharimonadales bacterium]
MKYTVVGQQTIDEIPTMHRLVQGDARDLSFIPDASIHLVVTSPPYWTLKRYNDSEGQMGHIAQYEHFLAELNRVWAEAFRILVPGGRLVCVVGDVCLSRRENNGRHTVVPLHADICVQCRKLGFDNLNPIIWHKISNASYEVSNGSKFLGKPYEPNAIIKNDIEFILMQRKPGGYRKPTAEQRRRSMIPKEKFDKWFQQFWTITGASTKEHPAPFPFELASRLVQMFSFTSDTVLDPFCGTATTMVAALKHGRNSIGVEIDTEYCKSAASRLLNENGSLFGNAQFQIELKPHAAVDAAFVLNEPRAEYKATRMPKHPPATIKKARKNKAGIN